MFGSLNQAKTAIVDAELKWQTSSQKLNNSSTITRVVMTIELQLFSYISTSLCLSQVESLTSELMRC
jgi:hypothetical protein